MSNHYGRQYTAQPYGLNTPAAFAFVFNIIYPVFFSNGGGDAGFILGYRVALAANFVTGTFVYEQEKEKQGELYERSPTIVRWHFLLERYI